MVQRKRLDNSDINDILMESFQNGMIEEAPEVEKIVEDKEGLTEKDLKDFLNAIFSQRDNSEETRRVTKICTGPEGRRQIQEAANQMLKELQEEIEVKEKLSDKKYIIVEVPNYLGF